MAGHPAKQSDLKTLVELSALIGSSLDIQTVLDNAMTCAQAFMNAEASAVFELDMPRGELFFSTDDGQGGISPVFFNTGRIGPGWHR